MSWREWLLDGLFPPTCLSCGEDGAWVCESCLAGLEVRTKASCAQCGQYPWSNHFCDDAWEFSSFISVGAYGDPLLQRLLRSYKYKRALCLDEIFEVILKKWQRSFEELLPWPGQGLMIASLPMDEGRFHERGLDHAALLADHVHRILLSTATRKILLKRTRQVVANATLHDPLLRAANTQDLFEVIEPVTGPVLLVDDVCTSGATAREAARTLLAAGVPEVHLFTFASGVKRKV